MATTTFAQYREGATAIKHPMGLVLGWTVNDHVAGLETRYALYETGKVARSAQVDIWSAKRHDFDFPGQRWLLVGAVPDQAKFIGYYQPPRNIVQNEIPPCTTTIPSSTSHGLVSDG